MTTESALVGLPAERLPAPSHHHPGSLPALRSGSCADAQSHLRSTDGWVGWESGSSPLSPSIQRAQCQTHPSAYMSRSQPGRGGPAHQHHRFPSSSWAVRRVTMLIWGEGEGDVLCEANEPTQDLCHRPHLIQGHQSTDPNAAALTRSAKRKRGVGVQTAGGAHGERHL